MIPKDILKDDALMESIAEFRSLSRAIVERVEESGQRLDVLEIGCGSGLLCHRLAQSASVRRVVGIEPYKRSADVARLRAAKIGKRVEIHGLSLFSDLGSLGHFDVVVSRFVYHHICDFQKSVGAFLFRKLLKAEGGIVLIGDMVLPEHSNDMERLKAIRDYYAQTLAYAKRRGANDLTEDQRKCATRDIRRRAEFKVSIGGMMKHLREGGLRVSRASLIKNGEDHWPGVILVEAKS